MSKRRAAAQRGAATKKVQRIIAKNNEQIERDQVQNEIAAQPEPTAKPYMVVVDGQGVAYLRVSPSHFILNTGKSVELIEMDRATVRSRALQEHPEASVMDAAKILARPLTESVTISARAKPYLDGILNDKELIEMTKEKKTHKSAKASAAKSAKAAGKANGTGKRALRLESSIVKKFKEPPYREGSARQKLLDLAVKTGTVGKFYDAAGKPKGGSASAYLGVFVRDGHVALQ